MSFASLQLFTYQEPLPVSVTVCLLHLAQVGRVSLPACFFPCDSRDAFSLRTPGCWLQDTGLAPPMLTATPQGYGGGGVNPVTHVTDPALYVASDDPAQPWNQHLVSSVHDNRCPVTISVDCRIGHVLPRTRSRTSPTVMRVSHQTNHRGPEEYVL